VINYFTISEKRDSRLTTTYRCQSYARNETSGAVCKTGQNFKEKLRELGGLDAVFEITLKCQSDLKAHFLGLKQNLIPQATLFSFVEVISTIIKFLS
ncbi:hypothetical protein S83_023289, partial [Arachis hypogaea]